MGQWNDENDSQTILKPEQRVKRPRLYKVLLLNDDFTPMDFVILILKRFFDKNGPQAEEIMLQVHNRGVGIAGVYPLEVAEMKALQVNQYARQSQHPLTCSIDAEEEDS